MSPHAYRSNLWIGYDDQESLITKVLYIRIIQLNEKINYPYANQAQYANMMNLGGSMVWSIETDDFQGSCHGKPFIMIQTIVNTMNGGSTPIIPTIPPFTPTTKSTTPSGPTTTADPFHTTPTPKPDAICKTQGLVPDPESCASFYDCIANPDGSWTSYKYQCGAGTVFSPDLHTCTWPDLVPGCESYGK